MGDINTLLRGGNVVTQLWTISMSQKVDAESGIFLSIPTPPSGCFTSVALSQCGEKIAAADRRGNVFLFDMKENTASILHRSGRGVVEIIFSSNGLDVLVALNDSTVRVLNRYV
jgi:WD40 repeat protein